MVADGTLLEAAAEAPTAAAPVLDAGAAAEGVVTVPLDVGPLTVEPRRGRAPSPCSRFAWGAAGSGVVLFLAAVLQAAGTWALSAAAVAFTVASIAGVIAMEGCEEVSPRSSPPVRPRPRSYVR